MTPEELKAAKQAVVESIFQDIRGAFLELQKGFWRRSAMSINNDMALEVGKALKNARIKIEEGSL